MSSVTKGDVTVTADDEALLEDGLWLNDVLLAFWCEEAAAAGDEDVLVIPPNMTYFLQMAGDGASAEALKALKLGRRRLVVAVVNNTTSMTASGTHWSVLCYSRATGLFYHYDSASPTNRSTARRVAEALRGPLEADADADADTNAKDATRTRTRTRTGMVVDVDCPTQPNSWMCGDYACAFVTTLVGQRPHKRCKPPASKEELLSAAILARTVRNIMRARIAHLRSEKK